MRQGLWLRRAVPGRSISTALLLALLLLKPSSIPVALPSCAEISGTNRDHLVAVVAWLNWSAPLLCWATPGLKIDHSRMWTPR